MATFKSNIASAQDPANGETWKRVSDGSTVTGDVIMAVATVTLTAAMAANDVFNLVKLPSGFRVVPHLSKIAAENPGTTLTLQVGDDGGSAGGTADPDRYSGTVAVSAGGNFDLDGGVAGVTPVKTDSETWIQAKIIAAAGITADQKVTFWIALSGLS